MERFDIRRRRQNIHRKKQVRQGRRDGQVRRSQRSNNEDAQTMRSDQMVHEAFAETDVNTNSDMQDLKLTAEPHVKQPVKHMVFDDVIVPRVEEPRPKCSICGQVIETIADAITEPDGRYSHFDCVIARIKEEEAVSDDEVVSYIGHGNFAVFKKSPEGQYTIKTRIPYESKEAYESMKKFVERSKV